MRKLLTLLCLSAALFIAAPGCQPPQTTSGKIIVSTQQTVDAAMKSFAQYVKAKEDTATPVAQTTINQVDAALTKYKAAFAVASAAWVASVSSPSSTVLGTSIATLAGCQTELLALIATFTK